MLVYRLENRDGKGPMNHTCEFQMNIMPHAEPDVMARQGKSSATEEEVRGRFFSNYRFGWGDLMEMAFWIKYPRAVDNSDWRIVVYETEEYITFADGQVMFAHDKAEPVGGFIYTESRKLLADM